MAIVETIPGIRRIIKRTPDAPIAPIKMPYQVHILPLQENDIPELVGLLHRGLDATPDAFLPAEDKDYHRTNKTLTYYKNALKDPDYHAIFVAKDEGGNIIGVLETTKFQVDGVNIGYMIWINVDPEARQKNVGLELVRQYEEYAQQEGFTFVMANVRHTNIPSRSLLRRAGFRGIPYLQKPAEANWYVKQLNLLPDDKVIPITETDFLLQEALDALSMIQEVMHDKELGKVEITYHHKKRDDESLVSVAVPDHQTREKLQTLFFAAAEVFLADEHGIDSQTILQVKEKVLQIAGRFQRTT
jgi:ribosomal protein S18 acetylase RimI-like enzyme